MNPASAKNPAATFNGTHVHRAGDFLCPRPTFPLHSAGLPAHRSRIYPAFSPCRAVGLAGSWLSCGGYCHALLWLLYALLGYPSHVSASSKHQAQKKGKLCQQTQLRPDERAASRAAQPSSPQQNETASSRARQTPPNPRRLSRFRRRYHSATRFC